ncbi:MAG: hypothetical protein V8S72_07935 [Oscillospiraceae bacterium]
MLYNLPDLCDSVNYSLTQFGYAPDNDRRAATSATPTRPSLIEEAAPDAAAENCHATVS